MLRNRLPSRHPLLVLRRYFSLQIKRTPFRTPTSCRHRQSLPPSLTAPSGAHQLCLSHGAHLTKQYNLNHVPRAETMGRLVPNQSCAHRLTAHYEPYRLQDQCQFFLPHQVACLRINHPLVGKALILTPDPFFVLNSQPQIDGPAPRHHRFDSLDLESHRFDRYE